METQLQESLKEDLHGGGKNISDSALVRHDSAVASIQRQAKSSSQLHLGLEYIYLYMCEYIYIYNR